MAKKRFKWFPNVARYRNKQGRFVAEKTVSGYIDKLTRKFSASVYKSANNMLENFSDAEFSKWSMETRRKLTTMHNAVTVIALGGKKASMQFAQENRVAWSEAETALGDPLRYFDRFRDCIRYRFRPPISGTSRYVPARRIRYVSKRRSYSKYDTRRIYRRDAYIKLG